MEFSFILMLFLSCLCIISGEPIGFHEGKSERLARHVEEAKLAQFITEQYEPEAIEICTRQVNAMWNYAVDVNNEEKQRLSVEESLFAAMFSKEYYNIYFSELNPNDYKNETLKRKITYLTKPGSAALDEDKLTDLLLAVNNMTTTYSISQICPFNNQNCSLESDGLQLKPDLEDIMANSRNESELKYVWKAWRDATGAKMRHQYKIYVDLSNDAAKANNFSDLGELWKSVYEMPSFEAEIENIWQEIKPLYDEIHKYVRNKLKKIYTKELFGDDDLIPAHLLGDMWAQNWKSISDIIKPYPNATNVNVTKSLIHQGYTPLEMFKKADEFYQSLGLNSTEISYNVSAGAMIEKPSDREVQCHASAWDFCNGQDYRIKMCTQVNFHDFLTIHHEIGHIVYYMLCKDQPIIFREGANPGFHEAIGDTIVLSVATPKHLKKIGLLESYDDDDKEASLNALMDMALEKVVLMPFALVIDKWRWDVFAAKVSQEEWNSHWWKYRELYQKVKAPVARSENDFDPGSKFHITADTQFISYFIARVLQFQFYKALCIEAKQYDPHNAKKPLHKCDFYKSTAAGDKLRAALSLGASKHWTEVLEKLTGETKLSGSALLEYFNPLYDFLKTENSKEN